MSAPHNPAPSSQMIDLTLSDSDSDHHLPQRRVSNARRITVSANGVRGGVIRAVEASTASERPLPRNYLTSSFQRTSDESDASTRESHHSNAQNMRSSTTTGTFRFLDLTIDSDEEEERSSSQMIFTEMAARQNAQGATKRDNSVVSSEPDVSGRHKATTVSHRDEGDVDRIGGTAACQIFELSDSDHEEEEEGLRDTSVADEELASLLSSIQDNIQLKSKQEDTSEPGEERPTSSRSPTQLRTQSISLTNSGGEESTSERMNTEPEEVDRSWLSDTSSKYAGFEKRQPLVPMGDVDKVQRSFPPHILDEHDWGSVESHEGLQPMFMTTELHQGDSSSSDEKQSSLSSSQSAYGGEPKQSLVVIHKGGERKSNDGQLSTPKNDESHQPMLTTPESDPRDSLSNIMEQKSPAPPKVKQLPAQQGQPATQASSPNETRVRIQTLTLFFRNVNDTQPPSESSKVDDSSERMHMEEPASPLRVTSRASFNTVNTIPTTVSIDRPAQISSAEEDSTEKPQRDEMRNTTKEKASHEQEKSGSGSTTIRESLHDETRQDNQRRQSPSLSKNDPPNAQTDTVVIDDDELLNTQTSTQLTQNTDFSQDYDSYDFTSDEESVIEYEEEEQMDTFSPGKLKPLAPPPSKEEEPLPVSPLAKMRMFKNFFSDAQSDLESLWEFLKNDFSQTFEVKSQFGTQFRSYFDTMIQFCVEYLVPQKQKLNLFLHPLPESIVSRELTFLDQISEYIREHHAKELGKVEEPCPRYCMAFLYPQPSPLEHDASAPTDVIYLGRAVDQQVCITAMCQTAVAFSEGRLQVPLVQKLLLFSAENSDFYLIHNHAGEMYIIEEQKFVQKRAAQLFEVRMLHKERERIDDALLQQIDVFLSTPDVAHYTSYIEMCFQELTIHRAIVKRRISKQIFEFTDILNGLPAKERRLVEKSRGLVTEDVNNHPLRMALSLTFGRPPQDTEKMFTCFAVSLAVKSHLQRRLKRIEMDLEREISELQKSVHSGKDSTTKDNIMLEENANHVSTSNMSQISPKDVDALIEKNTAALALYSSGFSSLIRPSQYKLLFEPDGVVSHVQKRMGPFVIDNIALGKSQDAVRLVNEKDILDFMAEFDNMDDMIEAANAASFTYGCECLQSCTDDTDCACAHHTNTGFAYTDHGTLKDFNCIVIYECNSRCECTWECPNRVAQRGSRYKTMYSPFIEVFHNGYFWGARTTCDIPCGSFVVEYTGERIDEDEAERRGRFYDRSGLSYLFDVSQKALSDLKDVGQVSIDGQHVGNCARFFNHSCDPNLIPKEVVINNQDLRAAHICFFAKRDIAKGEELVFDYGYVNKHTVRCLCGAKNCRGYLY